MSNEKKTLLQGAKLLITPSFRWTQKAFARDINGEGVSPHNTDAICYCSVGALLKASELLGYSPEAAREASDFLESLLEQNDIEIESIVKFNDSHTHEEVLALFDKAIEAA